MTGMLCGISPGRIVWIQYGLRVSVYNNTKRSPATFSDRGKHEILL